MTEVRSSSVVVIDDHELVSAAMVLALREAGLDAARCPVTDVAGVLAEVTVRPPGLILLDLDLGRDSEGRPVNGVDLIGALRAKGCAVLVVSGSSDRRRVAAAIAAGAEGWVSKSAPLPTLIAAATDVAAGRAVMSSAERAEWLEYDRAHREQAAGLAHRLEQLTAREREVLDRMVDGRRAAAIAEEFVVSLTTVRTQIHSILTKLGVSSQLEAVALVRERRGW